MKLSVVLVTSLLALVNAGGNNFLKARADVGAFNKIVPMLKQEFFPFVSNFVNAEASKLGTNGAQDFGDKALGGRVEVGIRGLNMHVLGEDISVNVEDTGVAGSLRLSVEAADVKTSLRELAFTYSARTLFGVIPLCDLDLGIDVKIPRVGIEIDVGVTNDTLSYEFERAWIDDPLVKIDSRINDVCSFLVTLITQALKPISGLFADFIGDQAAFLLNDAIDGFGESIKFNNIIDLPLGEGLNMEIEPAVASFRANSLGSAVDLVGGLSCTAYLSEPEWRNGFRYIPSLITEEDIPNPADSDKLINMNAGSSGVNSMFEAAWYLVWSTVATDESASRSNMCKGTGIETDPCPFPPLQVKGGAMDRFVLGLLYLSQGLFKNFQYSVIVPPPGLSFEEDKMTATATPRILVEGISLFSGETIELTSFTAKMGGTAHMPSYDSETGLFSGVALADTHFKIEKLNTNSLFGLQEKIIGRTVSNTLSFALDLGIPLLNEFIGDALAKTPLKIEPIPIPDIGISIQPKLLVETGGGVVNDLMSYLELGADLTVEASYIPFSDLAASKMMKTSSLVEDFQPTVKNSMAYQWASESDEINKNFTSVYTVDGEKITFTLRVNEDLDIELLNEVGEWTTDFD